MQVLFIQGGGAGTHDEWDNKLVASLEHHLGSDYQLRYPRMPDEDDPSFARWKPVLLSELASLDEGAILVGHSIGGTMLLHVLAERPRMHAPRALALLSVPYIGNGGWPSDELRERTDFGLPPTLPVFIYQGTADDTLAAAHSQLYSRAIPHAKTRVLSERDHQLNNDLVDVARDLRAL